MRNKKIYFVVAIILIVCLSLCFVGCGKKKTSQQDDIGSGIDRMDAPTQEQEAAVSNGTETGSTAQENTHAGKRSTTQKTTYAETVKASKATSTPDAKLSDTAKEYADYCAMSSDEQYAYYKTFKSGDDFMNWYNKAKAKYEKENPTILLKPGTVIDLGE